MNKQPESAIDLKSALHIELTSCRSSKMRQANGLRRKFAAGFRRIKQTYFDTAKRGTASETEQWIFDNYYFLDKLQNQLKRQLHHCWIPHTGSSPDIFLLMRFLLRNQYDWNTGTVMEAVDWFEELRPMTNFEFENLGLILSIAAFLEIDENTHTENIMQIKYCLELLFNLEEIDFNAVIRSKNHLEKLYQRDPLGVYPHMDETSKQIYRNKTSDIAIERKQSETALAERYLREATEAVSNDLPDKQRHVGYYIYRDYDSTQKHGARRLFLLLQIGLPALLSILLGFFVSSFLVVPFSYFLFWEILRPILTTIFLRFSKTEYAPRLKPTPENRKRASTLVTVSTLFASVSDIGQMAQRMEKLYFSNQDENVHYCILADLRAYSRPRQEQDAILFRAASKLVKRLNRELAPRFSVVIRKRTYCETQENYCGWERKRGAITELVRYLKTGRHDFALLEGKIAPVSYLLALDSDTIVLPEDVNRLMLTAVHPLHRPEIDPENGRVTKGYAIFVPRISTSLPSSMKTPFAKIFGGIGGINTYDPLAADLYQDLYGESIFSGKGLIDIDAYYQLLDDYFPDGTVLSHDILESGMLRTRFVSDVEMVDSFPSTALSYYKRQHRWVRGDVQNAGYMAKTVATKQGMKRNSLSGLHRFQLFDNLRRAFHPVLILLAIVVSVLFLQGAARSVLMSCALLAIIAPELFSLLYNLCTDGIWALSKQYYSRAFSHVVQGILKSLFQLILLAQEGYTNLDAIIRAWYRKAISHKKLLEWTTAAQGEGKKISMLRAIRFSWFSILLGILLLIAPYSSSRFFGIFFVFSAFLVFVTSEPYSEKKRMLTASQRAELVSQAAAMYRYYQENCNERENFLPPDNVQQAPVFRVAHRTSPTNIGMYLLSVLSARDLDLIDSPTLEESIRRTLNTIDRLDKWNGNLYNWYDTRTLSVLQPAYVSVVDSGNFLCCLVALKEGLKEYVPEMEAISALIPQIDAIIDGAELQRFYDKNKKLFCIGFDEINGQMSKSHYDMLMSEARMTSYFAVARHQIPKEHWSALSRTLVRYHGYAGPVSWTGTMFEYFMPELLLTCPEGSLGYEGLRFCLNVQTQYTRKKKVPFGISESAFYSFDPGLNYQYKAHGVQKIALKQGMDEDLVLSPYSSYLTLPYQTEQSYRNLCRFYHLGMKGRYGLYEAVDFTPKRVNGNRYEIVKNHMAHHIGMSLVALNNTLRDGIMQKRFLHDREMNSAAELLQERILSGSALFEGYVRNIRVKPSETVRQEKIVMTETAAQLPHVKLLSNEEFTSVLADTGVHFVLYQGMDVLKRPFDLLRRPIGFFAAIKEGNQITSLTSAPLYKPDDAKREVTFEGDCVCYHVEKETFSAQMEVSVHHAQPGELRDFSITNHTGQAQEFQLLFYCEPVLAKTKDERAHPAFSKLFLQTEWKEKERVLLVKRKPRDKEGTICLALAFREDIPYEIETCRENILTSPDGIRSLWQGFSGAFQATDGSPDPCVAMRTSFHLPSGKTEHLHLMLSTGTSEEQALATIEEWRAGPEIERNQRTTGVFQPNSVEDHIAEILLPQVLFRLGLSPKILKASQENRENVKGLWKFGISGDLPVVLIEIQEENDWGRVQSYIYVQNRLRVIGIPFDLVVLFGEGGEYYRPHRSTLETLAKECGSSAFLNTRGGIFSIDYTNEPAEVLVLLRAAAVHIAPKNTMILPVSKTGYQPIIIQKGNPLAYTVDEPLLPVCHGSFAGHRFFCDSETRLPWCHVLANPSFGTLVSNKSLGFTWAVNARENKLTPWDNDTMSDNQGELLLLRIGDMYYDLISGSRSEFHLEYACYHAQAGPIEANVKVTVAGKGMQKNIQVTLRASTALPYQVTLAYYTEPILGVDREHSRQISATLEDGTVVLINPFQQAVRSVVGLRSTGEDTSYCFDKVAFFSGNWKKESSLPGENPCAALLNPISLEPGESADVMYTLAFQTSQKGLQQMDIGQKPVSIQPNIQIQTPDKQLDAIFNAWLMHQVITGRVYARTGFYQCGGAWGFRDQLQDSCVVLFTAPEITKRQILRACASQFLEGDVLHWWHQLPEFGGGKKGVRTRYSDDLLWLPYTVCEYLEKIGDNEILAIPVAYCDAPVLENDEQERYVEVKPSSQKESVYQHCIRAIEKANTRGEHGLPLIGCGDWNDGMNHVGRLGKGESVWLAQFLAIVLRRFALVCRKQGDDEKAQRYLADADQLLAAVEELCWDGKWYVRAFTDFGEILGSKDSMEAKIDSLPQSFSVLADMPDKERSLLAVNQAKEQLFDSDKKLVKLFTPPYQDTPVDVGYIRSYPPGMRENGGQYTHAAIWLAMALLEAGETEQGYELIRALNPVTHSDDPAMHQTYQLEPYYIAADIYTNPYNNGRGGWSIYTGSASWYYRCILEYLLGIRLKDDILLLNPHIPQHWPGFTAQFEFHGTPVDIEVVRTENPSLTVNGRPAEEICLDGKPKSVRLIIE